MFENKHQALNQKPLNMRRTTVLLISTILLTAACSPGVKKTPHGVKVAADDGTNIRIEVVKDDIIHVEAVPAGEKFSER